MLASAKVLNLTLSGVVDFRVQWEQRESYHYSADRWIRRRRRRQLMLQEEKPLVPVSPYWIRFTGRAYTARLSLLTILGMGNFYKNIIITFICKVEKRTQWCIYWQKNVT